MQNPWESFPVHRLYGGRAGQKFSAEVRAKPALVTRCLHRATLEFSVKGYIVRGANEFRGRGDDRTRRVSVKGGYAHCESLAGMVAGDRYRAKALQLLALADGENNETAKAEFENLAAAFLRLAGQAERNAALIIEFELPSEEEGKAKPN